MQLMKNSVMGLLENFIALLPQFFGKIFTILKL